MAAELPCVWSTTACRPPADRLPTGADGQHAEGWDHFLPRLQERAAGHDPGPDTWAPHVAELIAADLRDELAELRSLIENSSDEAWNSEKGGEGWSLGVTASHAIGHLNLAHMIAGFAAGEGDDLPKFTQDGIDSMNVESAATFATVSRAAAIAEIDAKTPAAIKVLREFPPENLATSAKMAFAGGAELSALDLLNGGLLGDFRAHLASAKAAR